MNSRSKGARGEREAAAFFKAHGFEARRGQQFKGGTDSPDVVVPQLPGYHFEIKRVEAGNPYVWMQQATRDAGAKTPVVCHRKNDQEWLAILPLTHFLFMLQCFCSAALERPLLEGTE